MTKSEQSQIKTLLQSPQWRTVELLVNAFCDKISYDSVVRESEWDTIKTALINEGKVRGIKEFIQEMYNQAQQV